MRITIPALIIAAILLYRLVRIPDGGKEPVIVSFLFLVALVYKFCADGREREKSQQVDAQARSEDDYSVREWMKNRGLGPSSEAVTVLPDPRASKPLPAENDSTPINHVSADPVRPPGPTWGQLARRLMSATVITFCYLLLAVGVGAVFLPYYRLQTGYEATQATVMERALVHQVIHGKDSYSPRLRLRYQAGGVTREQWCDLDSSHFYRSVEGPTAPSGLLGYADRTRAGKKLPYPVGSVVRAWYRPGQPELVVVPDSGVLVGAVGMSVVACVVLFAMVGVPIIGLFGKAWNHRFVFRRTTGRVLRGEVRSHSTKAGCGHYYAVLHVQRTGRESTTPLAIEWGKFSGTSAAAAELGPMLAAHPIGQTTPVWFDPAGRYPPAFESFGFLKALVGAAALVVRAPATLVTFPFQVIATIARTVFPRQRRARDAYQKS
jgi:hypothetical protein